MLSYEAIGDGGRPPVWHSLLLALFAGSAFLVSWAFSPAAWGMQHGGPSSDGLVLFVAFLAAGALCVGLFWRHRHPFRLALVSSTLSLVLPLGNVLPLIYLGSLIGRRKGRGVWLTMGFGALASTWVVFADALAQPLGASLLKSTLTPTGADRALPAHEPLLSPVIVAVLSVGIAIGAGFLARSRREAASAAHTVRSERAASGRLSDEVARRQERERIAREVHDVMGHRLSLLSLHAGALEANSGDDPRVAQSAQTIRENASAAMDDLRSLLSVLREPLTDAAPVPLSRLAEVVAESADAGQQLNSSIYIEDADSADPALSRAVYRIVQELLTNARRHAPGQQVLLSVRGSPASGVQIDARNNYVGGWGTGQPSESRGLAGITERCELLGGTMRYGLDDAGRTFRAHVELPWRETPR